ncbi:NAD(P)H-dependent oxidoreductase subunit E [Vannielia litorea]|uniref:NAD-dependent formate dehydrogenase flavoprotein subunit n=1 Tax=Vannielia litorea TaxID=1217970 RepID=A0A1N6GJK9_9RHOB|nr:NAD(P)H-dependent oxidoreductase subunit E [Vannielia litorea]SIO07715.1 NAD-dependent formate dehydrogenase flavoprotein subunit [Vannielia litorea]
MNQASKEFARRDASQPKGRQVEEAALEEVSRLLGEMPRRRDMLIEALHLIQDGRGHLSAAHLAALAELFRMSQAEVYEVATFYHHFDVVKEGEAAPAPVTIRVCESLTCTLAGSARLIETLKASTDPERLRIQPVPCIGACDKAPAAQVGKRAMGKASAEALTEAATGPLAPVIPDYEGLAAYRATGGYGTYEKIRAGDISPEAAIETMSDAGLRGLGGAGFPAGKKWGFVRGYEGPRLMTVNGDEGEPGTFKDRWWLERQPHRMLEGALIAAHVVGCERIYIYMRDEYPAVLEILRAEVEALEHAGLAHVPIEIRRGAGAYICGEESAMIESIEGKRGLPRHRPPYIAEVGLFGRPTLNHNVETLLWVPEILRHGAAWFADQGQDADHSGLRSYSVSGRVAEPGVKLAPAGIPLRQLIEEHCGGMAEGHELKAFLPGGASGGIFPASMADTPLNFGCFEPHGGFIGSHAVMILSQQDSIREAVLNLIRFFEHESCGQCTPCRSGTAKAAAILAGDAPSTDLLNDLVTVMTDSSICGLGQAAGNPIRHLIRYFPEELA